MVNPRKAYPVDPGLISTFARSGGTHVGRALETAVLIELERRGWPASYVRTPEGYEVDFVVRPAGEEPLLVQVSLETEGDSTWDRELRALEAARAHYRRARALLVTLDASPPSRALPKGIEWVSAAEWLLGGNGV
jgi:predicted AAA+ superfamily ATPase